MSGFVAWTLFYNRFLCLLQLLPELQVGHPLSK